MRRTIEIEQAPFIGHDEASVVSVERAASELRYGRPVIVREGQRALAALSLDTARPDSFSRFGQATEGRHALYLTPQRAAALGLVPAQGLLAPQGLMAPLRDRTFEETCQLGYGRERIGAGPTTAAGALAAEASVLACTALLLPAVVCADIERYSRAFLGCVEVTAEDVKRSRAAAEEDFEIVARTVVPLRDIGPSEFVVFRGGLAQRDQVAIVVGQPRQGEPVPVRIHSSCITGDLFGSLKCDCGDQLRSGLKSLKAKGGGILFYLDQEGRGTGIGAKMLAYGYQSQGLDTIDADAELGFGPDERRYGAAVAMLRALDVSTVDLLTNNPMKIAYLRASGIVVSRRTPVVGTVTAENEGYLRTKSSRAGHMIDVEALVDRLA